MDVSWLGGWQVKCRWACLLLLANFAESSSLTFQTPGVYGNHWLEYALRNADSFDFFIYQARPHRTGVETIHQDLRALRARGLRLVIGGQFYETKTQRGVREGGSPLRPVIYYEQLFDRLLAPIADLDIEAVTIEEENVFWGGRAEFLGDLYKRVKSRHPDRVFYQWYSPRRRPSIAIPGVTWPDIEGDGWVIDQYGISDSPFEIYIDQMDDLGKPLLGVVWASPQWRVGDHSKSRNTRWWNKRGWQMLHSQLAVYRKHDVPVAFFMYTTDVVDGKKRTVALHQSEDECDRNFLAAFEARTLSRIRSGGNIPLNLPRRRPRWIPGVCG